MCVVGGSVRLSRALPRRKGGFFFEGWYFKLTPRNNVKSVALIPGILVNDEEEYGFVMWADPSAEPVFEKYNISDVVVRTGLSGDRASDDDFAIAI